jgi:UDP-GlcNAc:undecaprenyl-phosphate/decaprenyl-phosphate GlcNAc-1-phosphate transferase
VTQLSSLGLFFAIGAALSVVATAAVRTLAPRLGAIAVPRDDRWHRKPVPLLGGAAIWCAVALPLLIWFGSQAVAHPILIAATLAMLVGVTDDFLRLKPSTKVTAQIAIASLAVVAGVSGGWTGSGAMDAVLSIAWIVGLANAFNLLDNMDGLSAGVAGIAAAALTLTMTDSSSLPFAAAALIAGSAAGFLVFNFSPASIFMGDSGSLFLGSALAMLALTTDVQGSRGLLATLVVPVLLLLIPIFDTAFVAVSRLLSSRSATVGGRDHTSHRLVAFGFSERQAVLMLYGFAGVGGFTAVALTKYEIFESHLVLMGLLLGLLLLAVQLARVRVYGGQDFSLLRDRAYTPLLIDVTYKRRVFEVLLDSLLIGGSYYAAYVMRFDAELPEYYPYLVTSLPIVLACHLTSFFVAGVYRGVWRFFSVSDLTTYLRAVLFGTLSSVMVLVYLYRFEGYSRGVFLIHTMALLLLLGGSRASFRILRDLATRRSPGGRRALIYGAGEGGVLLLRELRNNPNHNLEAVGFIDDDDARRGRNLGGRMIFGAIADLPRIIAEHDIEIVVLGTSKLTPERRAMVERICHESGTGLLQFVFSLQPIIRTPADS